MKKAPRGNVGRAEISTTQEVTYVHSNYKAKA